MIEAVFFDLDGVLVDTERQGHRVAFNKAFKESEIAVQWDENLYHELLSVAGGKERIAYYFRNIVGRLPVESDKFEDFVKTLHKRKTEILIEMIGTGELPLRPGVRRFIGEIVGTNKKIALCTTSNRNFADSVLKFLLPEFSFDLVLAGDIVKKKKPDPEIYNMALEILKISPQSVLVVEDSQNGVQAAAAAGIKVLATTNAYTESEDLSSATIIVDSLGDEYTPANCTKIPSDFHLGPMIHFSDIEEVITKKS
ncbi:HAD-IA family hydrolase [Pleomorphochaeta sp. DL1XJH-081]|uniref:HAD-IA family hydrolase n=1 Tax=Pleomorphochaeta sp. DL1XJH-081 TaxID=3409690 RepID=UPI003BB72733